MWEAEVGILRFNSIVLEGNILKPKERLSAPLWPFKNLGLPTDFYNVKDAKTAIAFERQYAPLGYDNLVDRAQRKGGDPLNWVLEHACFVRLTLDLMEAIAREDSQQLIELLRSVMAKVDIPPFPEHSPAQIYTVKGNDRVPGLKGGVQINYPSGAGSEILTFTHLPDIESDAEWMALSIVSYLVNDNSKNIRVELYPSSKNFVWLRRYRSLIEAVWSMVGELSVKATHEDIGLRKCLWCGAVFQATHKRQRFCPPFESPYYARKQSSCGLKYRQHKLKQKGGKGNER